MDSILTGEQPADSRLPSVRDYAANTGVNPNTMMRTYTWLQNRELITMKRGIGYFVTSDAPRKIGEMRRRQFFDKDATIFMLRLQQFGITPDELKSLYQTFLDSTK